MSLDLRSCHATHPGTRRKYNEDRLVDRPDLGVWAVADGAGGHEAGDIASGLIAAALEAMPAGLNAQAALAQIRARMDAVHNDMQAEAARRGADVTIASTAVILCVRGEHYACLWAGDSRAYRLARGALRQITRDHSLVQELVDAGQITPQQAETHPNANVITRAVGALATELVLDKTIDKVSVGDRFLLCSDGLTKSVPEAEIAAVLAGGGDPATRLIEAALARQARDNVTAVVIDVVGSTLAGG
jgi:protein phosphatase/serine/threonine-protein phosphatase Stp1